MLVRRAAHPTDIRQHPPTSTDMAAERRPHRPTCAPWVAVAMTNLALAGSLAR
jgi:hypothetical protein